MPVWRLQVSIGGDSAFPRDRFIITPHFDDGGLGTDPDGLCQDLAEALTAWLPASPVREVWVKAYDAQGTPPVFPQGDHIINEDAFPASGVPRELALCLSFYGGQNVQRRRGRLYLYAGWLSGSPALRPSAAMMQKIADLAPIFEGLGGPDVDWVVYSRADDTARPVTNWWVDNEWDIMRSRGLRPTDRLTGTTSEA